MLFEIRNLIHYFPIQRGLFRRVVGYTKALNRVSLKIEKAQILGVCGESGCGKSTLGRCAARLLRPTAGMILLDGHDTVSLKERDLASFTQSVQMVFQDPYSSLNPRKSILQAFLEPLMKGPLKLSRHESLERTWKALEQVSMSRDCLERYPHQFSGGQQQRLCLARALIYQPRLIICDEILSALDLSIQAQIMELLRELREQAQVSFLFISHDLVAVRQLCDRVAIMYLGEVVEQGDVQTVFGDTKHPYTQALIDSMPMGRKSGAESSASSLRLLQDEPPSATDIPSGCPFHPRCPRAIESCSHTSAPYQTTSVDHGWRCIWP